MRFIFNFLSSVIKRIEPFVLLYALFCISIMVIVVLAGVFSRYLLAHAFFWTESLAIQLNRIRLLFGMCLVLEKRENVRITYIFDKFSKLTKSILEIIYDILIILAISVFIYQGCLLTIEAKGEMMPELFNFPKMYIFLHIPLVFSIKLIYILKRFFSNFLDLEEIKK